jgi:hypothetical protein
MSGNVGFGNVANFAYTYPGSASGVVANAHNGYGDSVGDGSVIVNGNGGPTAYFIAMENSGYVLQQDGSKIQLET